MIKFANAREAEVLKGLPAEVVAKVIEIATILDGNYGEDRDVVCELGGYIHIAEDASDRDAIEQKMDFDLHPPEFVDLIPCSNGENYTCSLMLLSSDYSVSLIMPYSLTPESLLCYLEKNV